MRPIFALLLLISAVLFSSSVTAAWLSDSQDIMGTRVSVTLWHEHPPTASAAVAAVMKEMRRIDAEFSPYIDTSQLSRANRLAPQASEQAPLSISAELTLLIDKSLTYGRLSDGAFDITFASLGRYYDYRARLQPSERQSQDLLPAINYRLVHLDARAQTLYFGNPHVYLDLGGIAKGYAVDRAMALVRELGIKHAHISAGGDSRVLGDRFGRPWVVGIKDPRAEDAVAIRLPLQDVAISTSGDYERYFIDLDGKRVHHILNPRTGKSTQGIASVSVIGPNGFDTDPLSTTVFVLGVEKGLKLINALPDFDAIIITTAGDVHYSNGLASPDESGSKEE